MQLLVAEDDVSDLTVSSHSYELQVENRLIIEPLAKVLSRGSQRGTGPLLRQFLTITQKRRQLTRRFPAFWTDVSLMNRFFVL